MKSSLQSKIASAMWVMTAVSTLAAAILTGTILITSHKDSIRQQLQATATSLITLGITNFSELKDFSELNHFVEDALQMDRVDKIIRIYDSAQKLLFTTAGADYDILPATLERDIKKPAFLTIEGKRRKYESLVMPYEGLINKKTFYLQVVIPLPRYSGILEGLWWQSLLLLGVLIGISVILSQLVSERLLKPVGAIAGHLEEMHPLKVEDWRPINLGRHGGYLNAIADGINTLGDRTRTSILKLRKMSRYVAHEMRTPLTILRGEAEVVLSKPDATLSDYQKVLKSSLEEIQRMSEIVNTVLQVGETDQTAPFFQPSSLELVQWMMENKPMWEKTLGRKVQLDLPSSREVIVNADPKLLSCMADNLVRNVRNHTSHDAQCTISLAIDAKGATLSVSDDGPGMAKPEILSLNQDGSSSDMAGVGLSLCYRIAEISGLRLYFSKREGGGLKAEVHF